MRIFSWVAGLALLAASNSWAVDVLVPLQRVENSQGATALAIAQKAQFMVGLFKPESGLPSLRVFDISKPEHLLPRGVMALPKTMMDQIGVSPDGRWALLVSQERPPKFEEEVKYTLMLIDLANPAQPKSKWSKEVVAARVALAPDTSAYVFMKLPDRNKRGGDTTKINVVRINNAIEHSIETIQERSYYFPTDPRFSSNAQYLYWDAFGSRLEMYDLKVQPLRKTEQRSYGGTRFEHIVAAMDKHVVTISDRFSQLDIYAPKSSLPRVAAYPLDDFEDAEAIRGSSEQNLFLASNYGRELRRFDFSQSSSALKKNGFWLLPVKTHALLTTPNGHVYATDPQGLVIFHPAQTQPFKADWKAFETAHAKAMKLYHDKSKVLPEFDAIRVMQEADIQYASNAPLNNYPARKAASILNDFGFLLAKKTSLKDRRLGEAVLRRAMALDPDRALAPLNLADLLRIRLGTLDNFKEKQKVSAEIEKLYRKYLNLGGKMSPEIETFLNFNLGKKPLQETCQAIADYTNAGRLGELFGTGKRISVNGNELDLVFTTEGSAHVPAVYAYDAVTGSSLDNAVPLPGQDFWGDDELGLIIYRDGGHILHFKDMRHPVATAPLSGGPTCGFRIETTETLGPDTKDVVLCSKLVSGERLPTVQLKEGADMDYATASEEYSETAAIKMGKVDFTNSGKLWKVVELEVASGAGPGCGANFYDVVDKSGTGFLKGPQRELLLKMQDVSKENRHSVSRCSNNPRFFVYEGITYFEDKPHAWPPENDWEQYHKVRRIVGGKVENICDFHFLSKVYP